METETDADLNAILASINAKWLEAVEFANYATQKADEDHKKTLDAVKQYMVHKREELEQLRTLYIQKHASKQQTKPQVGATTKVET